MESRRLGYWGGFGGTDHSSDLTFEPRHAFIVNTPSDPRLSAVFDAIDAFNDADPNVELENGVPWPKERLYSRRMSAWLDRLAPDAPLELKIAARGQHIGRWQIPREEFPADRAGYHRWRSRLQRYHAERLGEMLSTFAFSTSEIERVQSLVRKERLKQDPETQLLEDVICLVFLESYFADFATRHDEEKLIGILRKTWPKMSPRGQQAALGLHLPDPLRKLVERALEGIDSGR